MGDLTDFQALVLIFSLASALLKVFVGGAGCSGGVSGGCCCRCVEVVRVIEPASCLGYRGSLASHPYERPCRTLKKKKSEAVSAPDPAKVSLLPPGGRRQVSDD